MSSRTWLYLTVPVALAAFALLAWTIASLLRTVRASVIATVPMRAEQRVDINSSGSLALNLEGALFTRIPSNLHYTLSSAATGATIPLLPSRVQTHVTSMSRSRMEIDSFSLPASGTYVLRIDGLDPSVDYGSYAIVITRQVGAALVLHILALIALGFALIGSLVASGLIVSGKSLSPAASSSYDPGSQSP
jgi:hypothetical protein